MPAIAQTTSTRPDHPSLFLLAFSNASLSSSYLVTSAATHSTQVRTRASPKSDERVERTEGKEAEERSTMRML